jgi:hypothetical protein
MKCRRLSVVTEHRFFTKFKRANDRLSNEQVWLAVLAPPKVCFALRMCRGPGGLEAWRPGRLVGCRSSSSSRAAAAAIESYRPASLNRYPCHPG